MSFFRNLRSSLTRGRSSSRDTTPVRNSRSGSVISSLNSGSSKRRESVESRSDSLLNRSGTFILDDPDGTPCHSNCSTLEKKSKKSKVLEKFSTFTKRKKNPPSASGATAAAFEHHPSDNATNTYYKWQAEGGGNSLDYDSQNDPFNFLYEQQSSLKSLHNGGDSLKSTSSPPTNSFDSSTYRKSKMPNDLKKQLKVLRDQDFDNQDKAQKAINNKFQQLDDEDDKEEEEVEKDDKCLKTDKYKTVTLNSFRRSFREKFLQQQKEAAHNPAWFVEVETPEINENRQQQRETSKENRRDLLVFENDNFRPGSRSPIRDFNKRKEVRTSTRSPVKRNETFKVERLSRYDKQAENSKPDKEENTEAIHIEFKNSITPHIPGRMVPVGVAKPMRSQLTYNNIYRKMEPTPLSNTYTNKSSAETTITRLNNHSPIRSSRVTAQSPSRIVNSNPTRLGRYQTLVQIKNEKYQQVSPITLSNSRHSTRIQLGGNTPSNWEKKSSIASHSPSFGKRYNSSQIRSNSGGGVKAQSPKQTYFGDTPQQSIRITQIPSICSSSRSGSRTRPTVTSNYGSYKYNTPSSLFASVSSLTPPASASASATEPKSSRTTPSHSVNNIYSSSNNNLSYLKLHQQQQPQPQHQQHQQQHHQQTRFLVTGQRRSRSPIKVPWR